MSGASLSAEVAEFYAADASYDPVGLYRRLRENDPVHHSVFGFWVVARYADAVDILRSNRTARTPPPLSRPGSALDDLNRHFLSRLGYEDHRRLRGLVQSTFSPRNVKSFTDRIVSATHAALTRAERTGSIDLSADLAQILPTGIFCELFAIPQEDRATLKQWFDDLALANQPAGNAPDADELAEQAAAQLNEYLRRIIAERRSGDGDDLLSRMIQQAPATNASDDELVSVACHLLAAGTQTTVVLLTHSILALLRDRDQLAVLRADPALAETAVDECLRFASPTRTMAQRIALEDIPLDCGTIPAGEQLTVWVGAANRDPAVFTDPDVLDIRRRPNHHLSFSTGAHFCLGSHLARLEASTALRMLVETFDAFEVDESAIKYGHSALRPRIDSLPVAVHRA